MDFAHALRALMDERGISGNALARRVHCDKGLISRFVNGKQQPSPKLAGLIDKALGAGGELAALAPRPAMWRPPGLNGTFSPARRSGSRWPSSGRPVSTRRPWTPSPWFSPRNVS